MLALYGGMMFNKLKWIFQGQPMITYPGFICEWCGKWNAIPFSIPKYKSRGEWFDNWGVCPGKCNYEERKD
jgi:hypothetical protein